MQKIYLEVTPFPPPEESFCRPYVYDHVKAIDCNSVYGVIVIKMVSLYEKITLKEYTYQGIRVYNFRPKVCGVFVNKYNIDRYLMNLKSKLMIIPSRRFGKHSFPLGKCLSYSS